MIIARAKKKQLDILEAYSADFPRYARKDTELKEIALSSPSYRQSIQIRPDFTRSSSKYLRRALDALNKADVLHLIYQSHSIQASASYNSNRYKLLFLDIGLVERAINLPLA